MKVLSKKIENSQALLTVEMAPAEVAASLEKSYARLVKKADIPGFRRGKAPRAVLEQHIGRETLLEDALDYLLPKACADAIQEEKIDAFAQPIIKVTQTDPVVFEAAVPQPPTVKLADYYQIKMKPEPVKLKKDDVSIVIEQLRHKSATREPVERPVMVKDLVIIDIEGSIEDKPFIGEQGVLYQVLPDSSFPVPGFAKQLLRMKRGGEKKFRLKIPKNYPNSEQADKEALFRVKVIEVKEEILPELNDVFAKGIAPGIETLASLRERVSIDLKQRAKEKARIDFEERVVDAVTKKSEVKFPTILVAMEVDHMVNQELQRWQMAAKNREEYSKWLERTPEAELREKCQPLAVDRLTTSLVLGKVAEAEKIEVSNHEVNAEIERVTENTGQKKEEQQKFLNSPQAREQVNELLMARKTVQLLVKIAKGSSKKTKTAKKEAK